MYSYFRNLEKDRKIDNKEIFDIIKDKISFMLIQFFETKIDTDFQLLEYLDLIWILDIYEYKIPVERLGKILNKSNTYFEFMVLLSYIKKKEEYNSLKEILFEKIISNFEKNKDCIFNNTETFLLFFDTLKCPWLTDEKKKIILDIVGYKRDKIKIIKFVETKDWFFIWDNNKIKLVTLFEIKKSRVYR